MTIDQYEADVKRINDEHFNELMKDFDEMEKIAGQPDPEPTKVDTSTEIYASGKTKKEYDEMTNEYVNNLFNKMKDIREEATGKYGQYDRLWKKALKKILDSNSKGYDTEFDFGWVEKDRNEPKTKVVDKAVNQPNHYQFADMSVQDLIKLSFTHLEYMGWIKGNIIKYRMRAFKKGRVGPQDIAKADEYQKFYDDYVAENTGNFL